MVAIPEELRYTKDHEWIKIDGDVGTEGITDYAQNQLSDIVMVELPAVGRKVKAGESVGTIEAVKAVAELYSAVSGEIVAVNEETKVAPDLLNKDPYGKGWLIRIRMSNPSEVDAFMNAAAYAKLTSEPAH